MSSIVDFACTGDLSSASRRPSRAAVNACTMASASSSLSSFSASSTVATISILSLSSSVLRMQSDTSLAEEVFSFACSASRLTSRRICKRASGRAGSAFNPRIPDCTMSRLERLPSAKTVRSQFSSVTPSLKIWQLHNICTASPGALNRSRRSFISACGRPPCT